MADTVGREGLDAGPGPAAHARPAPPEAGARPGERLSFRSFTMLPAARLLLRDGEPVEIGSRAFDLLHILLRSRGGLVERADLIRQVWPTTIVDESNLRFQVACLRKALGRDRDLLKTVPGRGYLLAADVGPAASEAALPVATPEVAPVAGSGDDLQMLLRLVLAELRAVRGGQVLGAADEGRRLGGALSGGA